MYIVYVCQCVCVSESLRLPVCVHAICIYIVKTCHNWLWKMGILASTFEFASYSFQLP